MAHLFPDLPPALGVGHYREREMLSHMADSLPSAFCIFHGLHWSSLHEGTQRFGELDAVVLSPTGHLAIVEIKSGDVDLSELGVFKDYGPVRKDVGRQARTQLHSLIGRLRGEGLDTVQVCHFLLLPDYRVPHGSVGYPRERIIDASQLEVMHRLLVDATTFDPVDDATQERLRAFLSNRFEVAPDAACRVGHRQGLSRRLSAGLATWVPRITSPSGIYAIEATAGSGKTQLALRLLQDAAAAGERARYVCFNRPLADHILRLAPPLAEVGTVHEFAIAALRRAGTEPDFSDAGTFNAGIEALAAASEQATPVLDLLVIDESQDFDGVWIQSLLPWLRPQGRLYVLGDPDQAIYRKDPFDLPEATRVACRDNFRSPRRLVQAINALGLAEIPVEPNGPDAGEPPGFHVHPPSDPGGLACAAALVDELLQRGHLLADIAVLSFRGRDRSALLASANLGNHTLRKFTGDFDPAGNPRWTDGALLAESVYRFKGQSSPVVIVCEIDFDTFEATTRSKLFVAMTRAQAELHLVLSQTAEQVLAGRLRA